jgi:hypothetical protein
MNMDGPDAAKPLPKEETAKDAKSAKNLFLRLSRFSRLKKAVSVSICGETSGSRRN